MATKIPNEASREVEPGRPTGIEVDGVTNTAPEPSESASFEGSETETATPPTPAPIQGTFQSEEYNENRVRAEELGLTMEIQNKMINKFKSSTPDNMLGARALMTDVLGAFNRTVEWSLANNINAGPAYYMRHQLHYIYYAWKMVMDNHMPALTEDHKRGIESMEAEETEMKYRHGDNNERFRLWQQLQQSYLANPVPQWQQPMPTWQQPTPTWYYPVYPAATQYNQPTPLPQTSSTVAAAAPPVSSGQGILRGSPASARSVKRKSKQHGMDSNVEFSEDDSLKPNEAKRRKQKDAREARAARRQDKKLGSEEQ